jgi:hypothetical protein
MTNIFEEKMIKFCNKKIFLFVLAGLVFFALSKPSFAQYDYKWMTVGSMQSYYIASGSEIEEGRVKEQQDGLQWPGFYNNQDMSAAKGLWIGIKNYKDASGYYPYRVVHVGPRVSGAGEFFPITMKLYSKDDLPAVFVDDNPTMMKNVEVDKTDPTLPFEQLIYNKVNTLIGLTMERKIFGFSDPYHDNYIVSEYTFTNTGITDGSSNITRKDSTLHDVYFYFQNRWAICKETRYVVGNGSGWGMNTMNDTHWDGNTEDQPVNENFRTSFCWHGYWPSKIVSYNNIGGPIWLPGSTYGQKNDTTGRLGASQFLGWLTVFASKSAEDSLTDDPRQPVVSTYESSDNPLFSGNDAFNVSQMKGEYKILSKEDSPDADKHQRHAFAVLPTAKGKPFSEFANQVNPPEMGTSGGFSSNMGYGPYTIPYGGKVKLIIAEGAAGISREEAIRMGKKYKWLTTINPNDKAVEKEKNEFVLTGKDSLMQTWRRVIANYKSGWAMGQSPKPPKSFSVKSGGDKIMLSWTPSDDPSITGYEIYRCVGQYDSAYTLVYTAGKGETGWNDTQLVRGLGYYYYIVSVGSTFPGDASLNIPSYVMKSSRMATQTFDPGYLKRPAGTSLNQVRIVPNPYIISADQSLGYGTNYGDRIMFYNIPGNCTIKIYSELGELINTITHTDGSGDQAWESVTSSKQVLVSGIYIAVITDNTNGNKIISKFAIIR